MKRKFTTNSRVVNDLFTRYLNTFYAFAELLNNSIQATAKNIWIDVTYNGDMADVPIGSISVRDDGHGVHVSEIDPRLFNIGTTNKQHGKESVGLQRCKSASKSVSNP
ncbi:MAG: ATP-binding protein [Flavobacteriales bacterium]|nr:ATP-binding protein [Flavobacteriales bacterium]